MKKKISALAISFAVIAVCVSLIAGATFALFSSESGVNIAVTSAKVDVSASIKESSIAVSSTLSEPYAVAQINQYGNLDVDHLAPGDTVSCVVEVQNDSNIAIKYRTIVSVENSDLADVLQIAVDGATIGASNWISADALQAIDDISVSITLPEEVEGEEYMNVSCTISIRVMAVQGNAEVENYVVDKANSVVTINNIEGLLEIAQINQVFTSAKSNEQTYVEKYSEVCDFYGLNVDDLWYNGSANTNEMSAYTIRLKKNAVFDFSGAEVAPIIIPGLFSLDGNGATIKNIQLNGNHLFAVSGYVTNSNPTGAVVCVPGRVFQNFTVDNLTINAATGGASLFQGNYMLGSTIQGVTVQNSHISAADSVAAIISYAENNGTMAVKNCVVDNCVITASASRAAGIVGHVVGSVQLSIDSCVVKNCSMNSKKKQSAGFVGQINLSTGSFVLTNGQVQDNAYVCNQNPQQVGDWVGNLNAGTVYINGTEYVGTGSPIAI